MDLIELFRLLAGLAPIGVHVKEVIFEATGGHGKEPPEMLWIASVGLEVVKRLKQEGLWNSLRAKSLDQSKIAGVKEILLEYRSENPDVVIAMSYYSSTHTSFRELLTIHEDTGLLTEPGSFGNLPAAEVFIPPEFGTTTSEYSLRR